MLPIQNLQTLKARQEVPFQLAEPRFKKPEIIDPARVEGLMNPTFPPKAEENARMQTRLGGPGPR